MRPDSSFISQPVRSLQTMLRVLSKKDKSIPSVIPDGIYGPLTAQAVAAFQRQNELSGTGVVDQNTWEKIVEAYDIAEIDINQSSCIEVLLDPNKELSYGDSSPYIYLLQSILVQLSVDHASIDPPPHTGVLDSSTVISLKQFQKLAGLPETGTVTKETWKHLAKHFTLNAHHNERIERSNIQG